MCKKSIGMNKLSKIIFITLSKVILSFFYDRKYFKGKWYSGLEVYGWKCAWRFLIDQKIKGYNNHVKFPVNPSTVVGKTDNIEFHVDNIDNFWKSGSYFQCWNGVIKIGKGTWIAQNVGIITENHNIYDLSVHSLPGNVTIGKECWIGMNCVILPNVVLGDHTIVGAGSIVTKSFIDGNCIIAGNPAKIIKYL